MSRDRGVIRKMRSKSAIRKVRLQESVPDDIEMALSADEEFSSVLKEDRNEDSSDENSVGDNETDGERKVSTTYDIDTHSITFQSQFSPPPSDEEESDEHVDLGSDVDDDIDDFTITTEHEIKASDYLHATGATVTSSSTGFSGLSSDEEEKLADKRPSHHAESKVGEISFEDALKFGGDTNNNVLKVDDPRDNVLMNVPVAGMGTIMGKSKSRERTLEQQCAQAKRSQLQITYGELSALGKTDKNDVEKPKKLIVTANWLLDQQEEFAYRIARSSVMELRRRLDTDKYSKNVLKVEQENQRRLRRLRHQRWQALPPRERLHRKLACQFYLFAVNGRSVLDITEFEMMLRDLCVPIRDRAAIVETFNSIDVASAGCIDFPSFVLWYESMVDNNGSNTNHDNGKTKDDDGISAENQNAQINQRRAIKSPLGQMLQLKLKSLKLFDRITGRYDFLTARRVLMQLCVEQGRSEGRKYFARSLQRLARKNRLLFPPGFNVKQIEKSCRSLQELSVMQVTGVSHAEAHKVLETTAPAFDAKIAIAKIISARSRNQAKGTERVKSENLTAMSFSSGESGSIGTHSTLSSSSGLFHGTLQAGGSEFAPVYDTELHILLCPAGPLGLALSPLDGQDNSSRGGVMVNGILQDSLLQHCGLRPGQTLIGFRSVQDDELLSPEMFAAAERGLSKALNVVVDALQNSHTSPIREHVSANVVNSMPLQSKPSSRQMQDAGWIDLTAASLKQVQDALINHSHLARLLKFGPPPANAEPRESQNSVTNAASVPLPVVNVTINDNRASKGYMSESSDQDRSTATSQFSTGYGTGTATTSTTSVNVTGSSVSKEWEVFKDSETGVPYYYNWSTGKLAVSVEANRQGIVDESADRVVVLSEDLPSPDKKGKSHVKTSPSNLARMSVQTTPTTQALQTQFDTVVEEENEATLGAMETLTTEKHLMDLARVPGEIIKESTHE